MIKIYLHIGSHKTGTTALQNFLSYNRSGLIKNGVLYPQFGAWEGFPHHVLLRPIIDPTPHDYIWSVPDSDFIRTELDIKKNLEDEIERTGCHSVIISSECLFLNKPLFKNVPIGKNIAGYVKSLFDKYQVVPIVYLRNQVDWIESCYVEAVKGAHTCYDESFETYFCQNQGNLDYWEYLSPWIDHFGDQVGVFCYEQVVISQGSVERHFVDEVVSEIDVESFSEGGVLESNPSLSKEFLSVLVEFNRINKDLPDGSRYPFPYSLHDIVSKGWVGKGRYFNRKRSLSLLNEFEQSNDRVGRFAGIDFQKNWNAALLTRPEEEEGIDYNKSIYLILKSLCDERDSANKKDIELRELEVDLARSQEEVASLKNTLDEAFNKADRYQNLFKIEASEKESALKELSGIKKNPLKFFAKTVVGKVKRGIDV